ncbi:hypothetical protein HDU96_006038 [Phlyctochytrium bullatum]|nr:hypothetical protein HDU96_006038 [Phlyctochytrium bullatum]
MHPTALLLLALAPAALLVPGAEATVDRLCLRRCYNVALAAPTTAPTCSASIDLSDHENNATLACACATTFAEAVAQCGATQKCSNAADAAAADREVRDAVKDQCDEIRSHFNPDGTINTNSTHSDDDHDHVDGEDHDHDHAEETGSLPATRVRTETSTKTMALPTTVFQTTTLPPAVSASATATSTRSAAVGSAKGSVMQAVAGVAAVVAVALWA